MHYSHRLLPLSLTLLLAACSSQPEQLPPPPEPIQPEKPQVIEIPQALRGRAVAAAVGVPVLVNE